MLDAGHAQARGPLAGIRVLELAGIGPGPHAAMILGDLGADVVRVQRPGLLARTSDPSPVHRNRTVVELDLKAADDLAAVLDLIAEADVLIEGFRPGVAERLGIGPEAAARINPGIVYGRMTGWGQTGPQALRAGHDLNYIASTGLLHAVGRPDERPVPPLNLFGDFGGGSMFLLVGVLSALVERAGSGTGQVVDAAIVNGTATLGHLVWAMRSAGNWSDDRGRNRFDGSTPYYDVYTCSDGGFIAVAALEPQFFAELLDGLGLTPEEVGPQRDESNFPHMRELFTRRIGSRTRQEWTDVFRDRDACVTPVLTLAEAEADPQMIARGVFTTVDGIVQPAPAPMFSRTPAPNPAPPATEPTNPASAWADRTDAVARPDRSRSNSHE
ncbi:CaiB/BaiF CoA transferase family protein [Gordonia humi]|uniref:Alpha-methylacyl-CoA racemase n=1 Tax=Gordonia humi TaxID=686429 RepID=A0A840F4F9_9ACTN|nr:CaiB/BaiF CoA-transferase family protein [Gordonia humi]MBB4135160.1 alpha-methylacyl-CoA racemase [Gordonia humi]